MRKFELHSKPAAKISNIEYPPYGTFYINKTNRLVKWRAETFLKKEPTTIEWLQRLSKDSWLIDIGANIGIYSLPASLFHVKKVISVEPEPLNYLELLRNIDLNGIKREKIITLPVAISSKYANQTTDIYLSEEVVGGSCNQVGKNQNVDLTPLNKKRKTRSIYCISLEHLITISSIPKDAPLHIKVDVDGIEEDVCKSLFSSSLIHRLSSLQVELNADIKEHNNLISNLLKAGYIFSKKQVKAAIRKEGPFKNYAEYVFIPGFTPEQMSKLELPNTLQEQHRILYEHYSQEKESLKVSQDSFDLKKSLTLKPKLVEYSKIPPVAILKDILSTEELVRASNSVLNSISKSNSNFSYRTLTGSIKQESLRTAINASNLEKIDSAYLKYINSVFNSKKLVSGLIKASRLVSSILSKDQISLDNEMINSEYIVISRIRHFVDISGYYLSRHNDSHNTICALIIPLKAHGTSTSIAIPAPLTRHTETPMYLESIKYPHSFDQTQTSTLLSKDTYSESPNNLICKLEKIPLAAGDGAVIYNPLSLVFDLSKPHSDIYNVLSGHCLFPPINDLIRPILLVDYIIQDKSYQDSMPSTDTFISNLNTIF